MVRKGQSLGTGNHTITYSAASLKKVTIQQHLMLSLVIVYEDNLPYRVDKADVAVKK
jgi:hypothetical protein